MQSIRLKIRDLFGLGGDTAPEAATDADAIAAYAKEQFSFLPPPVSVSVEGDTVFITCPEEPAPDRSEAERLAAKAARRAGRLPQGHRHLQAGARIAAHAAHRDGSARKLPDGAGTLQGRTLMPTATLIVKLADLVLDPAQPGLAASLPPAEVLARLRSAYGFLAANTEFKIQGGSVVITFNPERDGAIPRVQADFEKAVRQASAGRFNKAIDLLRRVLSMVPEHTEARRNLAMALMESSRYAEAKDELVDLLRMEPENAWALMLLGNLFAKHENNLPVAETYLKKAHALDPRDVYALTNYAALKTQQGRPAEAQVLFEAGIARNPAVPNPYYGLATVLADADKPAAAWCLLERMFRAASFEDPRSREILAESRRLYLRLCVQVAEQNFAEAWGWVEQFKGLVATETGAAVELFPDDTLGSTSAKADVAWERDGQGHRVRYNPSGKAVVPALVARELERIRLMHRDRESGGIEEPILRPTGNPLDDSLLEYALLAPEQSRIDVALRAAPEAIHPSLFLDMYLRADEQCRAIGTLPAQCGATEACLRAFELGAATTAYFMDLLLHPRTAYGARYAKAGSAPRARELAETWHQQAEDFSTLRESYIRETTLSRQVTFSGS